MRHYPAISNLFVWDYAAHYTPWRKCLFYPIQFIWLFDFFCWFPREKLWFFLSGLETAFVTQFTVK